MPPQASKETWILPDNLSVFLRRVAGFIEYDFTDLDWDAIRFGVEDTNFRQDRWYEYDLIGVPPVELASSEAKEALRLHIKGEAQEDLAARIEALARVMQCIEPTLKTHDLKGLLEAAFPDEPLPEPNALLACNAAHLARCPDCQEVLSFFRGKHWKDLLQQNTWLPSPWPGSYASFDSLAPEARRFFFPAYLAKAIHEKDQDLLEALQAVGPQAWTPLQQELIEVTLHLLNNNQTS